MKIITLDVNMRYCPQLSIGKEPFCGLKKSFVLESRNNYILLFCYKIVGLTQNKYNKMLLQHYKSVLVWAKNRNVNNDICYGSGIH